MLLTLMRHAAGLVVVPTATLGLAQAVGVLMHRTTLPAVMVGLAKAVAVAMGKLKVPSTGRASAAGQPVREFIDLPASALPPMQPRMGGGWMLMLEVVSTIGTLTQLLGGLTRHLSLTANCHGVAVAATMKYGAAAGHILRWPACTGVQPIRGLAAASEAKTLA